MPYADPEKAREQKRKWKKEHPEYIKAYNTQWWAAHPEQLEAKRRRHNAKLKQAALARAAAGLCTWCGSTPAPAHRLTCDTCAGDATAKANARYRALHPDCGQVPVGRPKGSKNTGISKTPRTYTRRRDQGLCPRCGDWPARGAVNCERCDAFIRERDQKRRCDNPTESRERHLLKKYGITLAEWNAVFEAQGRKCYLCERTVSGGMGWHLDHDHRFASTDKRGHLGVACHRCNAGCGLFEDDPDIMERIAQRRRARMMSISALSVA